MTTYKHSIEVPAEKVAEKLAELKAKGLKPEVYGSGSLDGVSVHFVIWETENPEDGA